VMIRAIRVLRTRLWTLAGWRQSKANWCKQRKCGQFAVLVMGAFHTSSQWSFPMMPMMGQQDSFQIKLNLLKSS
jgi:hypothetical protein